MARQNTVSKSISRNRKPTPAVESNTEVASDLAPDTAPGLIRLALEMRAPWELGAALLSYPFMVTRSASESAFILRMSRTAA